MGRNSLTDDIHVKRKITNSHKIQNKYNKKAWNTVSGLLLLLLFGIKVLASGRHNVLRYYS